MYVYLYLLKSCVCVCVCVCVQIAIEGLSKILCMEQRKNIAKKRRPRRDHVTHHVTHVIDDGRASDGNMLRPFSH